MMTTVILRLQREHLEVMVMWIRDMISYAFIQASQVITWLNAKGDNLKLMGRWRALALHKYDFM